MGLTPPVVWITIDDETTVITGGRGPQEREWRRAEARIAEGVEVHESGFCRSNTVVVQGRGLRRGESRIGEDAGRRRRENRRMADTKKSTSGFTAEERAAMRQRAKELKAQESAAEALRSVLDKIASLEEPDRTNAERIHAIAQEVAPSLSPKLYYGSPGYADPDGRIVFFYQERAKFKVRYGNLAFFEAARLDDGTMWPTGFAVTELSAADEKVVATLIRRAAGEA
jgi:uncharacterized protein YdhG (YjbR/CyaY superfamily)